MSFKYVFNPFTQRLDKILSGHSSLTELDLDSHPQYLNRSGVRPMTGNLDMDSNDIINAGFYNGVDIEAHAARHLPNSADPLGVGSAVTVSTNSVNSTGTSNGYALSDHTHKVELGYYQARANDDISTTAGSPVPMPGMVLSSMAAGTYLVFATLVMSCTSSLATTNFDIRVDGTAIPSTLQSTSVGGGGSFGAPARANYTAAVEVTISQGQDVQVYWWRSGGTLQGEFRAIAAVRLL